MIERSWPRARFPAHRWAGATGVGIAVALVLGGCAVPNARGPAIESASKEFAGVQERVRSDLPNLPPTRFVEFIEGGGLKIGWSVIGAPEIELQATSQTLITAVSEANGVGLVDAVVTGVGTAGSGDLYDDARVYACYEVSIDIAKRSVLGYADAPCPALIASTMRGSEFVQLSDIS